MIETIGKCDFCERKVTVTYTTEEPLTSNKKPDRLLNKKGEVTLYIDTPLTFLLNIPAANYKREGKNTFDICVPCITKLENKIEEYIPKLEEILQNIVKDVKINPTDKNFTKFDILDINTKKDEPPYNPDIPF